MCSGLASSDGFLGVHRSVEAGKEQIRKKEDIGNSNMQSSKIILYHDLHCTTILPSPLPPPLSIHTFSLSFIWVFRVNHTWIKIHEHDSAIRRSGVQGMLCRVWRNATLFVKYHKTSNLLYVLIFPLMKKFYNSLAYMFIY